MSLAIVNLLKLIDSGAIHLIGSFPFEAERKTVKGILMTFELQGLKESSKIFLLSITFVVGLFIHPS